MHSLFDTFKTRAEAVSAEVHRFATHREAFDFVIDLLQEQGVSEVPGQGALWADGSLLKGYGQEIPGQRGHRAQLRGHPGVRGPGQDRHQPSGLGGGRHRHPGGGRGPGGAATGFHPPPIHVALVGTGRLRADLPTVLQQLHPSQTAYISLITGPSRTADIERVLTIGVHGPERLIVVFVDELEGGNA